MKALKRLKQALTDIATNRRPPTPTWPVADARPWNPKVKLPDVAVLPRQAAPAPGSRVVVIRDTADAVETMVDGGIPRATACGLRGSTVELVRRNELFATVRFEGMPYAVNKSVLLAA